MNKFKTQKTELNSKDINGLSSQLMKNFRSTRTDLDSISDEIDLIWASISITSSNIKVCTTTYVILDNDNYGVFAINSSAGSFTITLPTLADNQKRVLKFIMTTAGGNVTIDGEGSELIGTLETQILSGGSDHLEIVGLAGQWSIVSCKLSHDTGWINSNDWTNRHLGTSQVTYDGKSGTFVVGEKITESTSSNTGIITADSGTVLTLKNVTGTGIFTDNRTLTGATSGATCLVNETTSNKNKDTNVIHNLGYGLSDIHSRLVISTDKTEANIIFCNTGEYANDVLGNIYFWSCLGVSITEYKLQTGNLGLISISDTGTGIALTNQDYYYRVLVEKVF